MCKGLWLRLVMVALVSAGMSAPAARAADDDDGGPTSAARAAALNAPVSVIDVSQLTPFYRVTFMKSRTTDAIRTATVVSVTNTATVVSATNHQERASCDIAVVWLRGFDPTPVCTTSMSVDVGFQTDFCSRAIPDALTTCNTTCTPELTFHEGTAVVYSRVDLNNPVECQNLAVSARVYYTTGSTDSAVTAISDSSVLRIIGLDP